MALNRIDKNLIDPTLLQEVESASNKIGNLSELKTTNKTDIVKSVNEVTSQLADKASIIGEKPLISTNKNSLWGDLYDRGINVKWFGAYGDGVNDDTISFQTAIDYCITNSVGLYIPNGEYAISDLSVKGNISITGQSRLETVLVYKGVNTCILIGHKDLVNTYTINVSLMSFSIKGNLGNSNGLEITRTTGSIFEDIIISDFKIGLYVHGNETDARAWDSVYDNSYNDIRITGCVEGVLINGIISDTHFSKCQIFGSSEVTMYGVHFKSSFDRGSQNVSFSHCTIGFGLKSIFVEGSTLSNFNVNGCNFENFTEHGIYLNGNTTRILRGGSIENSSFYPRLGTTNTVCLEGTYANTFGVYHNNFLNVSACDIRFVNNSSATVMGNVGVNRTIIVDVGVTSRYETYGWIKGQDVLKTNKSFSVEKGNFIVEESGKGIILTIGNIEKQLSISGNGVLTTKNLDGSGAMRLGSKGTTEERQSYTNYIVGEFYFDTTLNKTVWVKSTSPTVWVDATSRQVWTPNRAYAVNDIINTDINQYKCTIAGTTGTTMPIHTTGTATNGGATFEFVKTIA